MKVQEYFEKVEINDLLTELFFLYPDQIDSRDGYVSMYHKIKTLEPKETTMRVVIDRVQQAYDNPEIDDDDYINVSGIDPTSEENEFWQSGEDITWAIEYNPWSEWIAMDVEVRTDDERCASNAKVLAHIIWEMSWAGYTEEEVEDQMNEIKKASDDLDELLATKGHDQAIADGDLIPLESILEKFEKVDSEQE